MQYGKKPEKQAIAAYKLAAMQKHNSLKIAPVGLVLHHHKACFGASPDSMVECIYCGKGVLEVKCPYCLKESLNDAESSNNFCLARNSEGSLVLKQEHAYFTNAKCKWLLPTQHTVTL